MASGKKVQVPVMGGLRKVIRVSNPAAQSNTGTTITEFANQTVSLAQLKTALGIKPTTGSGGGGVAAAIVLGPGLAGGGVVQGAVPINLVAPIPAFVFGDDGGGGGDGDPGPPGQRGVDGATGAAGPVGPAAFMAADDGEDGWHAIPGRDAIGSIPYYGTFSNSTNQANGGATTANVIPFDTTWGASGVSVVSGNQITFSVAGTYEVTLNAQFQNAGGGGAGTVDYWIAKNGTAIANSDQEDTIASAGGSFLVVSAAYQVTVAPGDYIQFLWSCPVTQVSLSAQGTATLPTRPASPGAIATVMLAAYAQPGPSGAQGPAGRNGTTVYLPDDSGSDDMPFVAPPSPLRTVNKGANWSSSVALVAAQTNVVYVNCPVAGTIKTARVVTSGGSGSCVLDVWKAPFGSFPPVSGNSITASAKPTIASGTTYVDSTLTGWTRSVSAGDVLAFVVQSTSTFTQIQLVLEISQ